ncbi:Mu-like prophage I protein [Bordetella ansorpii]|uniref:Mu-like prophage I protein n=1 Tax=Bordetella ansorpii TaxID=288768 RepID=A0A157SW88_9BORD|nr:phage protease [Bordetella ansorpii]SAI74575.1 Mu-like prophage I protein [Bordetella ansorpii]
MPKSRSRSPVLTTFAVQLKRDGEDVRELHLLPDGDFKPAAIEDARQMPKSGVYRLNAAAAARVIAHARASSNALPIDYEHQTQQAAVNGQPAPAAGWIEGANLVYRPGEGLFARDVQWTPRAKKYLDEDEYRYQSATFMHDPETGEVLGLVGAALTNRPALDGLTSARLAALSAQLAGQFPTTEDTMNPLLKALLDGLGLPETATLEQGVSALATLKTQAAQAGGLSAELATLKAAAPDPAKYVPIDTVTQLNQELATLRAQELQREIDAVIDLAKDEGRIASEAYETTLREVGKSSLAQLKALVQAAPANPALAGRRQTDTIKRDGGGGQGELTQAELAVCAATGISPDDFKKQKAALATG